MNVVKFLKEVKSEMARVEWPSWDEFIGATIVTLLLVLFFAVYFWMIDSVNQWVIYKKIFSVVKR